MKKKLMRVLASCFLSFAVRLRRLAIHFSFCLPLRLNWSTTNDWHEARESFSCETQFRSHLFSSHFLLFLVGRLPMFCEGKLHAPRGSRP